MKINNDGDPYEILAAGSRIFAEGRDNKSKATLAATRREKRSARRRRDRFKQRQRFLLSELVKAGLFPESAEQRESLRNLNPLELRAKAISDQPMNAFHIGRALFHLNQRRGFKSNRKDQSEETRSGGVVSNSARLLLENMGLIGPKMTKEDEKNLSKEEKKNARKSEAKVQKKALDKLEKNQSMTYGSFLFERQKKNEPTRARPSAAGDGKLYDVYPTRELYEDEFKKIWRAQALYHPEKMTEKAKERIYRAIFYQRPLKPQKRGKCTYMPNEDRTFRAMPSFQRYRIYQEVHSLQWSDGRETHRLRDHPRARNRIVDLLERRSSISFRTMRTELRRLDIAEGDIKFNLETKKRKGLDGNLTSNRMQDEDRIGPAWHDDQVWPLSKQDEFIDIILNGTPRQQQRDLEIAQGGNQHDPIGGAGDYEEVIEYLCKKYQLDRLVVEACLNARLNDDTAAISLRASGLMLEKMRDGLTDPETGEYCLPLQIKAASSVAQEIPNQFIDPDGKYKLLDKLPYYGEAFEDGRHIIPGTGDPKDNDKTRWGGVTNPTVHIALNQIRLVVNELIDRFGHPHSIAIELGRELPAGAKARSDIEKEQSKNQSRNERFDKTLNEYEQTPNHNNRLRLYLWEELLKTPGGPCCPFSGQQIGIDDLFSDSIEIDHLIPFSRSLDDSRANKIVCTRSANRDKGNRTPFEAFRNSPDNYDWDEIFARSRNLPTSKAWRFEPDAMKIWKKDGDGFTSRHLNDTRYIGRLTREYLECVCDTKRIDVVTGQLTSLLRRHWGLNRCIQKDDSGIYRKNRDDHRHHAVDAIVVGMTNRSMLQKVSTMNLNRLFYSTKRGQSSIEPWLGFRQDVATAVNSIIVSHKSRRKTAQGGCTDGQLHNDTAYGIIDGPDEKGHYKVVSRKSVSQLKNLKNIESIRDPHLRNRFRSEFEAAEARKKGSGVKSIERYARDRNIRRLRYTEKLGVIPIKNATGEAYKAYKGDSNWGVEIFMSPQGKKNDKKWEGKVISRFDANRADFKPGQTCRPHPAAKLVMRLQINDCVEMSVSKGSRVKALFRLQKISPGRMIFSQIHEANVDKRDRDKEDKFRYTSASAGSMQERNARKVHISPSGRIRFESRRSRKMQR